MGIQGKWMIKKDWDISNEVQIYDFKGTAKKGKVFILLKAPFEIGTYKVEKKKVHIITKIGCDFEYKGEINKDLIQVKAVVHVKGEGYYRGDAILRRVQKNGKKTKQT